LRPSLEVSTHRVGTELGFYGFVAHQLAEGLALGTYAGHEHHGHSHESLVLAVAAHTLPLTALFVAEARAHGGQRSALRRTAAVALATVVGFALADAMQARLHVELHTWLAAGIAGFLVHVIFHHDHDHRPTRRGWLGPLDIVGAAIGVALPLWAASSGSGHGEAVRAAVGDAFVELLLETAPMLLLGLALGAALQLLGSRIPARYYRGGGSLTQALRGIAVGAPLPLCACGVLPLAETLRRRGAGPALVMAFLIATPELGPETLALSVRFLGWPFAVLRLAAALGLALAIAVLFARLVHADPSPRPASEPAQALWPDTTSRRGLARVYGYFDELVLHTAPWTFVGLLAAAFVQVVVSEGSLAGLAASGLDVLVIAAVAMPSYVCAASATPLAAVLVLKGVSPGAVLVGLLGCNQPPPPDQDEPEPDPGPATNAEELFSLDRLPRFDLRLDAVSWAALEAEPKEWVVGTFEYAGVEYANVGIRLKGNHTLRTLDEKPAFKIKFNRYEPGRRFLGLEGLTLNNMVVDASMLREWLSFRVFRELGAPAPRAGYAQVWVNDQEYGLYLNIEPYDDEFLERVYDDPDGNLYESDKSADLDTSVDAWDQDEGSDESRDDLRAFSALALRDDDAVFYGDEAVVDMPRFLAFLAGETIVSQFDGHIGGHNFFVYHESEVDRWTYLPWSLDQSMARHVTPYEHEGYLGYKCLHDGRCLVDYVLASGEALDRFSTIPLEEEVARVIELTDDAVRSDPRKPYSTDAVRVGRDRTLEYALGREAELRPQLDCLVGGQEPDADEDGYGPCFQDCNEADPAIHPGAQELCDGVDDDCSGFADDVPECECPSVVSEGRTFYLCHNSITWLEARDFCAAQGRELARFESATQTAEVWAAAAEISAGRWAIGLNDREQEEDYRWIDGDAPAFSAWADGEPSHQLDWFDCVMLRGGAWYECNCIEKGSLICTDP
ncbi:MAG: CotH kinase family protein, partial [Myxococcales bacterium]|nr:CotH kinase family protein [Myxococcales bacterium]